MTDTTRDAIDKIQTALDRCKHHCAHVNGTRKGVNDAITALTALASQLTIENTVKVRDDAFREAIAICRKQYVGGGGRPPDDPHSEVILINDTIHSCIKAIEEMLIFKHTAPLPFKPLSE